MAESTEYIGPADEERRKKLARENEWKRGVDPVANRLLDIFERDLPGFKAEFLGIKQGAVVSHEPASADRVPRSGSSL